MAVAKIVVRMKNIYPVIPKKIINYEILETNFSIPHQNLQIGGMFVSEFKAV